MIKARIFGKRYCSFCGRQSMHYFKWTENGVENILGQCFTRSCGNMDYCDNATEQSLKERYANRDWVDMNKVVLFS